MGKPLVCIMLIFFFSSSSFSQIKLSGVIVDSLNKPIERASIQIRNSNSNTLLKSCLSDNDGKFTHNAIPDSIENYTVIVSHISYKKSESRISFKDWKVKELKIMMKFNLQTSLKEVVVKSLPINSNNDTTSYNLKAFVDGTEKTLEDVAKKLPGVIMNDDGSISFKGKRLTKILIEGEDLLANKTKLLSKNFPADLLDNVQLIENYNDNRLLKGFNQGDQTIMNLKLNKRKLKIAFGEIGSSMGLPGRQDYNAVIFSLLNKMKSATIANYNNIGKDNIQIAGLSIDSDDALQKISNFNYQNIINLPESIINPYLNSLPLPTQRWFFNNQTNLTHQTNYSISNRIKTKLSASFQNDNATVRYNRQSTYYQQGLNFVVADTNSTKFKPLKLKLNLQNDFDISNNQQLRLLFQFDANRNSFFNTQINNQINIKSLNNGELKNNISSFFALIDYANRIGENKILLLNTYFSTKAINQNYKLQSDNFSYSLIAIAGYSPAYQNNIIQNTTIGSQLQVLMKGNNSTNSVYIDLQHQTSERNNNLLLKSLTTNDSIYNPSVQRDNNNVASLKLGIKNTLKKGGTKLINTFEAGYLSWKNATTSSSKTNDGFFGKLESSVQQKFSSRFSGNVNTSLQSNYNNNHLLNDSFALSSNNELIRYTATELFNIKFDLSYNVFFISKKLLFLTLNGGFSYQPKGFIGTNNFSSSINFINNKFVSQSSTSNFLSAQLKTPLLKLKSRIEFSGSLFLQALPYFEKENYYSRFYSNSLNTELKYVSVFKTKLNGEVGVRYISSMSYRKQENITNNKFTNISIVNFSRLFLKYYKTNTISIFYNNYNLNINNEPLRLNFLDAEFNFYDERRKVQIEVSIKNLLNSLNYNQIAISPLFQSNTNYLLFGRSIDLGVKFKL